MSALKQAQAAFDECKAEQGITNGPDGMGEPKQPKVVCQDDDGHTSADSPGVSHNGQSGPAPGTGRSY